MEQVVRTSGGLLTYVHPGYLVGTVVDSPCCYVSIGLQRRRQHQSFSGLQNCTRRPQHRPEPVNALYELAKAIDAQVHFLFHA